MRYGWICWTLVTASAACSAADRTTTHEPVADAATVDEPQAPPPAMEPGEVEDWATAIVAAPDRTDEDRETDVRRLPAETLTFLGVRPGMKVADLGAGNGYSTELLARAVGPAGKVYAQNTPEMVEGFFKDWSARLQREAMADVVRVDRPYADPLPPQAVDLDLVVILFSYHDVYAFGKDPVPMNEAVFRALRPGGRYVVFDHSAKLGSGIRDTKATHRIDQTRVRQEIEAAGFQFAGEAHFLRSPEDPRDYKVWTKGFVNDRFAMEFVKP